jgi:hypothetical protein
MILPENRNADLPFVLSMGPQKAGTSWLDRYMRMRGDICLPRDVKEIFYFDRYYGRGADFYRGHFYPAASHRYMMEVSTTLFDAPEAARRVHDSVGRDVVLLCPLRHPVMRSYSLYKHYRRYGLVSGDLREACERYPQILESSDYAHHLERRFTLFGEDAVTILFQEDMESSSDAYIHRVCRILDLPYAGISGRMAQRYNEAGRAPVPVLARAAQAGADYLRAQRLYCVINVAKAAGMKPLFFGSEKSGARQVMSADDFAWLSERLSGAIRRAEGLIGTMPTARIPALRAGEFTAQKDDGYPSANRPAWL